MLRKLITSPTWQVMRHTGEELQKLPTKLMREAGLEELQSLEHEVQDAARQIRPPAFDERQIFGPSASTLKTKPDSDSKPESPSNKPEEPSEPPSTPDA
jgi:hypothetical protein